jgi:hypothetical protein
VHFHFYSCKQVFILLDIGEQQDKNTQMLDWRNWWPKASSIVQSLKTTLKERMITDHSIQVNSDSPKFLVASQYTCIAKRFADERLRLKSVHLYQRLLYTVREVWKLLWKKNSKFFW